MKIPKKFKLGRKTFNVRRAPLSRGVLGQVWPLDGLVAMAQHKRSPKDEAETFWHEVTHAILFSMNDPRWRNEKFVTAFSKRLNQVVHTAEF